VNKTFLILAWRETVRSSYWNKNLATTIGLGFLALYFLANFLFVGLLVPKILVEKFPNDNLISKLNSFILGYFMFDLIVRQLMQKLPTVSFRPLLTLNIRRSKIANYLLTKSLLSFFNLLPFVLLIPVFVKTVVPDSSGISATMWLVTMISLIFSSHYLNIYIKWRFNETEFPFFFILAIVAALFALNHFNIIDFSGMMGRFLDLIMKNPALGFVTIPLPALFYILNYKFLQSRMYLTLASEKKKEEKIRDYSWLDQLGETGRFIALELKLIWRNKRPRSVATMTVLMLAYGLLVYKDQHGQPPPEFLFILAGIILVGMFSISYGQFFPAWHSNYFSMLMCQRLTMKQFLRSFYMLVTVASVACYLITLPYAFIYTKIIYTHLAVLLYNLGINIPIMFWIGLYSKKRLELNQSSVMNYQGVGVSQWIAGIPLMLGPILFFYLFKLAFGTVGGYVGLGIMGLIGIILYPVVIGYFSKQYLTKKHQLIKNYKNS
jgi:hypothetical protein